MKFFFNSLLIIGLLIIAFILMAYNSILGKHSNITQRWAGAENQLVIRNCLIQDLLNIIKDYVPNEKPLLEDVDRARLQWADAQTFQERIRVISALDAVLAKLLLALENYPNLKRDETFLKLMGELGETQKNIAAERAHYNQEIRDYDALIRKFPHHAVCKAIHLLLGYKPATEYYKVEESAGTIPGVKF